MDNKRGYIWETAKEMLAKSLGCTTETAEELMEGMEDELRRKNKKSV